MATNRLPLESTAIASMAWQWVGSSDAGSSSPRTPQPSGAEAPSKGSGVPSRPMRSTRPLPVSAM